jgi:hypothetical protein
MPCAYRLRPVAVLMPGEPDTRAVGRPYAGRRAAECLGAALDAHRLTGATRTPPLQPGGNFEKRCARYAS